MSLWRRRAPFCLEPTALDRAAAHAAWRHVTPAMEGALKNITVAADERVILAGCAVFWVATRVFSATPSVRRAADRVTISAAASAASPHLVKLIVDRKRPDRRGIHLWRRGVPRSGNKWDSFPSGHAVHLGALGSALASIGPRWLRPFVWPGAAALAATRILLLAHYPTFSAPSTSPCTITENSRPARWRG